MISPDSSQGLSMEYLFNSNSPPVPKEAISTGIEKEFWQQWVEHRDRLYGCCLKLMNFNPTDAEDALSLAMLHAWEKVPLCAGEIANFKGWLMRLTYNFCVDLLRERSQKAVGVESIEGVDDTREMAAVSSMESPERVLEREEKSIEIRRAIASLPDRMRDTFILHFYEQLTHGEIVERQGISYDCACKRISLARKKLKKILRGYFIGSEVASPPAAIAPSGVQGSRQKSEVDAIVSQQRRKSPTSGESGEKQKGRPLEEKKELETARVSAEIECVEVAPPKGASPQTGVLPPQEKEVLGAEKSETMDGAIEPRELVGENISNVFNVSGELPLSSLGSVFLPHSTLANKGGSLAAGYSCHSHQTQANDGSSELALTRESVSYVSGVEAIALETETLSVVMQEIVRVAGESSTREKSESYIGTATKMRFSAKEEEILFSPHEYSSREA